MDTVTTTTSFGRGMAQPRDHSRNRRVFLDTYAKRRIGITPEVEAAQEAKRQALIEAAQQAEQSAQVQVIATAETPVVTQPDYVQPQPSVDGFSYYQDAPKEPVRQVQAVASEQKAERKNYLDTLNRRYQTAVAAAPAAVETVMAPTITQETESLFDDPAAEARIEANLNALYSRSLTDMIAKNTESASASHVRTIVASALACGILSVGIFSFISKYDYQPVIAQPIGAPVIEVESSNSKTPTGTPANAAAAGPTAVDPLQPIKVVISSIGVNAPVEGLGTTPEGLIAVPKAYGVVGWYNKGSTPGKPGPSVLVGHYAGGNGAVFDNLKDLKSGDLITTTNGRGQSYTYRVTVINEYEKDKVPMAEIFKSSKESRLEIITCAGKWQSKTYNNRLVVTAELVK